MNRFAYYSRDLKQTVAYVRSILPFLSDVCEFELYHPKKSPYVEVIQSSEPSRRSVFYNRNDYKTVANTTSLGRQISNIKVYTFLLRDDLNNEVWLYADPQKFETVEILHMLGLKEISHFQNKKSFQMKKLVPDHQLNILVEGEREQKLLLASYEFPYACKRLKAVEILHSYGYLNPILTKYEYGGNLSYFDGFPIRNNETYDFATNNTFLFEEVCVSIEYVKEIFDYIALETSSTVTYTTIVS